MHFWQCLLNITLNVPQFRYFKKCSSGSWIPGSQFLERLYMHFIPPSVIYPTLFLQNSSWVDGYSVVYRPWKNEDTNNIVEIYTRYDAKKREYFSFVFLTKFLKEFMFIPLKKQETLPIFSKGKGRWYHPANKK